MSAGVDYIAQSFVRSAADVVALRGLIGAAGTPIVAKIEKHEALADLDAIVAAADAVMVARGDLGVETSSEAVPVAQRRILVTCRTAGTPCIIATQMLESMIGAPRPTRAEASDVAHAIFDGADAVMLSGETAVGTYPVASLATMARIAAAAEEDTLLRRETRRGVARGSDERAPEVAGDDITAAVSAAVVELAERLDVAAILTATRTGATARVVARLRPRVPVIAATPDDVVARRLSLVWGVHPVIVQSAGNIEETLGQAVHAAKAVGRVKTGDLVALTAGVAVNVPGSTNLVQVDRVG
jgi:pyruvate kinase